MIQVPALLEDTLRPDPPLYSPNKPIGQRCAWCWRFTITGKDGRPLTIEPNEWGALDDMSVEELVHELEDLLGRGVRLDEVVPLIHEPQKIGRWRRVVGQLIQAERPRYPEIPLHGENRIRYSTREEA